MIHLIMYDHALSLFFFLLGWDGEGERGGEKKAFAFINVWPTISWTDLN